MSSNTTNSGPIVSHRLGGWLPQDQGVLQAWIATKIAAVEQSRADVTLAPVIQEFQQLIESDPLIYQGFHEMFDQVPTKPPYDNDPTGQPQV